MNKILLILTGGTIGSFSENGIINVNSALACKLVSMYHERFGNDVEFETVQPVNILSENMTYDIWIRLCECIDSVDVNKYSGIIICHGSDTLSYTSAFIGLLYNKLNIPVVLIAANYELENPKSNGIVNLRNAVLVVKQGIRGVFTAYSNNKGENDIYLATRIVESDPYTDQYRSFDGAPWGKISGNKLIINAKSGINMINDEFKSVINERPLSLDNRVMLIRPYPGMSYDNISLDGISAVVHYMYHSATACTGGNETSVLKFAERCAENKIKIYGASFKNENLKEVYKSSSEMIERGIIPLFNISPEAAYAKVLISENMKNADISKCWYFENV